MRKIKLGKEIRLYDNTKKYKEGSGEFSRYISLGKVTHVLPAGEIVEILTDNGYRLWLPLEK